MSHKHGATNNTADCLQVNGTQSTSSTGIQQKHSLNGVKTWTSNTPLEISLLGNTLQTSL